MGSSCYIDYSGNSVSCSFSFKKRYSYSYDKQGLHVKKKDISLLQQDALTNILDNMVLVEGGTFIMGNTQR